MNPIHYLPMKKYLAIIPARYASTRFPAKPLAKLGERPIIEHIYRRVSDVVPDTFVATDDERIADAVMQFGGRVIMTSTHHRSGTDRCWEAYTKSGVEADVVINVQGDEPFVHHSQIQAVMACFEHPATDIATLVKPFAKDAGIDALRNPNSPKVVVGNQHQALYFSRSIVPYLRGIDEKDWLATHTFYKHIGLYAYRTEVLRQITQLPAGVLEQAESLEQLRWLEAGYRITVGYTDIETIGIDTPEDLERAEQFLSQKA